MTVPGGGWAARARATLATLPSGVVEEALGEASGAGLWRARGCCQIRPRGGVSSPGKSPATWTHGGATWIKPPAARIEAPVEEELDGGPYPVGRDDATAGLGGARHVGRRRWRTDPVVDLRCRGSTAADRRWRRPAHLGFGTGLDRGLKTGSWSGSWIFFCFFLNQPQRQCSLR